MKDECRPCTGGSANATPLTRGGGINENPAARNSSTLKENIRKIHRESRISQDPSANNGHSRVSSSVNLNPAERRSTKQFKIANKKFIAESIESLTNHDFFGEISMQEDDIEEI